MQSIQSGLKKLHSGYDWLVGKAVERVDSWNEQSNDDVQRMEGFKKSARGQRERDSQSTIVSAGEPSLDEAELEKMSPNSLMALADKANHEEVVREKQERRNSSKRRSSRPLEENLAEEDITVPESYWENRCKEYTAQEWFDVQFGHHHVWNKMFVEINNTTLAFKHAFDPEGRAVSKINLSNYQNVQLSDDGSYFSFEHDDSSESVRLKPTEVTQPPDLTHWLRMFSGKLQAAHH